jgi:hypothetical protein
MERQNMTHRFKFKLFLVLAGTAWGSLQAIPAGAQQSGGQKPPRPQVEQSSRVYYDSYLPSTRIRTRRDTCTKNEILQGAFCVKACKQGYVLVTGSKPPKCRNLNPLPPGQIPGAERQESTVLKLPPRNPNEKSDPQPKGSRNR